MSDGVKIVAICTSGIVLIVSVTLVPENTNLLWGLFAAFCGAIGVPVASTVKTAIANRKRK